MTVEVPIHRKGVVVAFALVDEANGEWAMRFRWRWLEGYAARSVTADDGRRRTFLMHRELLGLHHGDPRQADHVNRNRLDNRGRNLRIVTLAQNRQNLSPAGGDSRFRGVHFDRDRGKWMARVKVGGVVRLVARFDREEEAAAAAAAFRAEHMPYSEDARALR